MGIFTWNFQANTVYDNTGARPWRKMSDKTVAATTSGNLKVTSTSGGYYADVSDIDFTRRWKILLRCRSDVITTHTDSYLFSIGPCYQNSDVGGIVVWRPAGTTSIRMDDAARISDVRREVQSMSPATPTWHPPIDITYDPTSNVRQLALWQEGQLVSTTPIGGKELDTTYTYLYIGTIVDSQGSPCSFESITLDTNWDGVNPSFFIGVGTKQYWRVRLLGSFQFTEVGLDTTRSSVTDEGVTIRSTTSLLLIEGASLDPIVRLYNRLYDQIFECTGSGWNTIEYTDTNGFQALQLRLGVTAESPLPTWCEIQYSNDRSTWFLDDRIRLPESQFLNSSSARFNCVATYQRNIDSGRWAYTRTFESSASFIPITSYDTTVTNKFARIPNFKLYNKSFSFSVWLYPTSWTAWNSLLSNRVPNSDHWFISYLNTGAIYFGFGDGAFSPTGQIALNQWHHLCFTFDFPAIRRTTYVNGVAVWTTLNAGIRGNESNATSYTTFLALDDGGDKVKGRVSNAALYTAELSSSEVTQVYTLGQEGDLMSGPKSGTLAAYYRLWTPDYTVDSSGNNRTLAFI